MESLEELQSSTAQAGKSVMHSTNLSFMKKCQKASHHLEKTHNKSILKPNTIKGTQKACARKCFGQKVANC